MSIKNGLFIANVMHERMRPKSNKFSYKVYYLFFKISEVLNLNKSIILSANKPNLFSFYNSDHQLEGKPDDVWVKDILKEYNIDAGGEIELITLPRLFGYVFNPVSFWLCYDGQKNLKAVISEVRNTFGEKHCYICFKDDYSAITKDDWLETKKIFHVSPFLHIEGYYKYRFAIEPKMAGIWIDYYDEQGLMLKTSMVGKRVDLNFKNLLINFLKYPLITFKVIYLIHHQAVKIVLKKIKYVPKPTQLKQRVSR
jgi:DUF1365 family protein